MEFNPEAGRYIPPSVLGLQTASVPNNSGLREAPPSEVAVGWNWGAFYFGWLWLARHNRVGLGIAIIALSLLPYLDIAIHFGLFPQLIWLVALAQLCIAIRLGLKGNEIAWRFRRFESIDAFRSCQLSWARWSLRVFLASSLTGILLLTWLMGVWH